MNTDGGQSPSSLQIARRLLAREAAQARNGKSEIVDVEMVDVLRRTCLRVSENLRHSVGEDGFNALLVRAIGRTEADHPALRTIKLLNQGSLHLDGVAASVETRGVDAVTAAIEALLAALFDILGSLIGEDMTIQLIDHDVSRLPTDAGGQVS